MCDNRNGVCMPLNGKVQCIDGCIHHVVAALNAGGVETVASCCGHNGEPLDHGLVTLRDGRVLVLLSSQVDYEARFGSLAPSGDHVHKIIEQRCECGAWFVDGRWMPSGDEEAPIAAPGQCRRCGYVDPVLAAGAPVSERGGAE